MKKGVPQSGIGLYSFNIFINNDYNFIFTEYTRGRGE